MPDTLIGEWITPGKCISAASWPSVGMTTDSTNQSPFALMAWSLMNETHLATTRSAGTSGEGVLCTGPDEISEMVDEVHP